MILYLVWCNFYYRILFYSILSYPILSHPIPPYPILSSYPNTIQPTQYIISLSQIASKNQMNGWWYSRKDVNWIPPHLQFYHRLHPLSPPILIAGVIRKPTHSIHIRYIRNPNLDYSILLIISIYPSIHLYSYISKHMLIKDRWYRYG